MRIIGTPLYLVVIASLLGCGPTVEQSPQNQAVADIVHAQIMKHYREYRIESGVKVMSGCLEWPSEGPVKVYGVSGYYYPTRVAMYGRPLRDIRLSSMGDCQKISIYYSGTCTCQSVDENGRNAIEVPDGVPSDVGQVTFIPIPSSDSPKKETSESAEDRREDKKGNHGPTHLF